MCLLFFSLIHLFFFFYLAKNFVKVGCAMWYICIFLNGMFCLQWAKSKDASVNATRFLPFSQTVRLCQQPQWQSLEGSRPHRLGSQVCIFDNHENWNLNNRSGISGDFLKGNWMFFRIKKKKIYSKGAHWKELRIFKAKRRGWGAIFWYFCFMCIQFCWGLRH